MNRRVTIKDVAELAGVSTPVVSAVLGGSSRTVRMSEATRKRVEDAVAATGYRANQSARALSQSRTGVIAAVVPKIANPVFEIAIRGMHRAAEDGGEVLMLADSNWIEPGTHLMARMAGSGMVDGFLVRATQWGSERIDELTGRGLPFVILQTPAEGRPTSVWIDDEAGLYRATTHLLGLGHRNIALLGGPVYADGGVRVAGFRRALAEHGAPTRDDWVQPVGFDPVVVGRAVAEVMSSPRPPTALVIDNVMAAQGAMAALLDVGARVPQDVSVVAYHDLPTADVMRPSPTTIRMPLEEAGRRAYRTLRTMIAGRAGKSAVVRRPGPKLIDRGSTARRSA